MISSPQNGRQQIFLDWNSVDKKLQVSHHDKWRSKVISVHQSLKRHDRMSIRECLLPSVLYVNGLILFICFLIFPLLNLYYYIEYPKTTFTLVSGTCSSDNLLTTTTLSLFRSKSVSSEPEIHEKRNQIRVCEDMKNMVNSYI